MKAVEKIPANFQLGWQWHDDEGRLCTTGTRMHNSGKREATLVESTFVGTCAIGAMHYYARIKVSTPGWQNEGKGADCTCGGYGGKAQPRMEPISIDAERVLTKLEKDMDGRPVGRIGEKTYRFNDEASARAAGIKVFLENFGPGWVLVASEIPEGADEPPVLAETSEQKPCKKPVRKPDLKQKDLL